MKSEFNILPEDEQAEIVRRRLICAECPFNSSNAVGDGYDMKGRIDEHCVYCGCTITRKTASLSAACGIDCCNAEPTTKCTCKKPNIQAYNKANNINIEPKWASYKHEDNEQ